MSVHRNIVSVVKPTRCANVSNLLYFGMTLYMFRTVFPSIIRRVPRLYLTATGVCQTDTAVCTFLELLMMEGKTVRNM